VAWRESASLLGKVIVNEKDLENEHKDQIESAKLLAETLKQVSANAFKIARDYRADAFADLLTTCATCHAVVRR
jgi:hypothetical protein